MLLLLVLSLVLGAAATVGAQDSSEDTYYMIGGNLGHPWWKQHFEGIEAAAEWLGINVEIVGPPPTDGIALEQIKLFEEIVAKENTAGIMMIGFDVTLIPEVSRQAMAAGIPFIQFNGDLIDRSARHAFVGTGDYAFGESAAQLVLDRYPDGAKIGVVAFISAQQHRDRLQGFRETLEASGRPYEFLEPVDDRASMDGAYNGALNLIEANPDMNIIYSGDAFAEGVANAVNDMGLVGNIDVVGGDRADSLLQAIKDGNVMGTIAQDTFAEGFFGVLYMYVAHEGLVSQEGGRIALPNTSLTQSFTITAETVDFFLGVDVDKPSLPAGTDGTYYMIGGNLGHPWWKQHFDGIKRAAEWLGINVEIVGPPPTDGIALEQIKLFEEIVAKEDTAGIMMIGFDVTLIPEISRGAMAAGIPFIQFNGDLIDRSARHAFVGTGDYAFGESAAQLVLDRYPDGAKIGVVAFISAQQHRDRLHGFRETLEASGRDYQFLEPVDDRASMDGAYNGTLNLIEANPDMDIIYSGDAFAEGVANAVKDMGLTGTIDVVGGDRADSLLQAIKDGDVMGTIAQDTFAEGFFGVVFMYVASEGLVAREGGRIALPNTVITNSFTITADTVDFFLEG
jgi:ribose transport system substrate-binding protein